MIDHIVHHLLTLWALGATPSEIQAEYDLNKSYQLLTPRNAASVSVKLKDLDFFNECLGNPKFYGDFLKFFQDEIAEKGVPDVVNEYVFKGDERADSVLVRMHSGEHLQSIGHYILTRSLRLPSSPHPSWFRLGIPPAMSRCGVARSGLYS
jgi:hypothetical protein